jgi:hypothetical protein
MIELLQAAERLAERYERTADMADKKGEKPKDDTEAKAGQDEGGEGLGISPEQKLFIKLAMALGLSDEAQPADILAAAIEAVGGGGGEEAAPEEAEKKAAEKLGCKSLDEAKAKLGTNEALTKRVEAAEKRLAERDEADAKAAASVLVNEQVDAGKLLPDDEKGMASALKYAEKDPDGFAETFAAIPAIIAPGRVTAASGKPSSERDKLIKAASKEYAEDPMMRHGKTDIRYYINASLAEEGQPNLTDVEAEKLKGAA